MFTDICKRQIKILLVASIIGAVVSIFLISSNAKESEGTIPVFQRGMCYATWQKDSYGQSNSKRSLTNMKEIGVEYVQIIVTMYQQRFNTTEIFATGKTPSDRSLIRAIEYAHDAGLKVMLKPHIDLIDDEGEGFWRGDIGFHNEEDWKEWFNNYEAMILHYAKIAEENNVEIFCVGTELSFASQKADYWRKIIAAIRKIYHGVLVYAANWDEYNDVKFWDDLDMAGVDAYFPLTQKENPTIEDIKEGWSKWKSEVRLWQSRINKPVVFTEIGYASSIHAPREPWASGRGDPALELQADCYTAFFEEVGDSPWLSGVYWWHWSPYTKAGGRADNHFTPMHKPAEQVIAKNYERIGTREILPAAVSPLEEDLAALDRLLAKEIIPFYIDEGGNFGGFEVYNLSPPMFSDVMTKLQAAFDRMEGAEVVTMPKGGKYTGSLLKDLPHGRGIIVYKNGDRYAGGFKNGLREGRGIFLWENGNIYMGEYKNGDKSGNGTFFWKSGNIYSGEFENDIPQGKGMEKQMKGFTYEGEFKGGYPHGKGVMIKRDGSRYEGEFKDGTPHGTGVLYKKDGETVKGEFRDGHYSGKPPEAD